MKNFKKLMTAAVAVLGLGVFSASSNAGVIDLGFALDASGSVGASNWNLQKEGFADALDAISLDGTYRVTFVSFATNARTLVGPTIIDSQAALDSVKAQLLAATYDAQWTNTAAAIDLIMDEWAAAGFDADDKQYLNIATDGNPCLATSCGQGSTPVVEALAAAEAAYAAGLDSLSVEAVGTNIDTEFLLELVKPQPGGLYNPGDELPNPLENGFVLMVDDYADFGDAVQQKIQKIVVVSEPLTAMLMGFGIFGLVLSRRRRG